MTQIIDYRSHEAVRRTQQTSLTLIGEAAKRRDRPFSSSSFFDIRYPCPPSTLWFKIDGLNRNPIAREIDLNFGYLKK